MSEVLKTLEERGKNYGKFKDHAQLSQTLKEFVRQPSGYENLSDSMKESLDMIMHKIARIINGDPTHVDSWHDISGYATLVEKELEGKSI